MRAEEDEPVFATTAGESVESRVQSALQAAEQAESVWERDVAQAEDLLAEEQLKLKQLTQARHRAEVQAGRAKALVEVNQSDFERLTKVLERLESLEGRCDHGDVEFSECQYVRQRKSAVNISWFQDAKQAKADAPLLAEQYRAWKVEHERAEKAVLDQEKLIAQKRAELRRLRVRVATSESARAFMRQSWNELQVMHAQRAQGADTAELVETRKQLQELESVLDSLRAAEVSRRSQQSTRVDAIKTLTATVSTRLLGAAGHARFLPGHEVRPFEVARGGEAYQVLEVLLGDMVCLLDSAVSDASNHPGFLVHDCPREADMSGHLYRAFFLAAAEAAEQLGESGFVPFQFIVTTTSAPPEELAGPPYVVLELAPDNDQGLLFGRQLTTELSGLDAA